MSYESTAEPIKVGYLMDFKLPDLYPQEMKEDLSNPFDLVFGQAVEEGLIDRPIQILYKEVEGLPKLVPSCQTPVRDGMVVHTTSPKAVANQKQVMEYLLINAPKPASTRMMTFRI